jgi:N-acetylglucosamine kinase-like BadF-type ATPase
MIQLIADSGSTKTHWVLLKNSEVITTFETEGLNPYHYTDSAILKAIGENIIPKVKNAPDEIHFYGAGCAAEEKKQLMTSSFKKFFPRTAIKVETDLLGAARAILKDQKGVVAILGTGSNAGIYDGKKIVKSFDSLGWIMGDEGSGVYIGKLILRDWLRGKFVPKLRTAITEFCPINRDEILARVYDRQDAAAFIASFAKFAQQEIASQQIKNILREAFYHFVAEVVYVFKFPSRTQINFCGSIAWHFKNQLAEEVRGYELQMGAVLKSPIDELQKYHRAHS